MFGLNVSIAGTFAGAFKVLSRGKYGRVVLELAPLGDEKSRISFFSFSLLPINMTVLLCRLLVFGHASNEKSRSRTSLVLNLLLLI